MYLFVLRDSRLYEFLFDVDRRTLARWRVWWQSIFPGLASGNASRRGSCRRSIRTGCLRLWLIDSAPTRSWIAWPVYSSSSRG